MASEAKHSFTIKNCRGMADKMSRELRRFTEACRTSQDPAIGGDHAINFAWTAWHLSDWVWRLHFKGDVAAQDDLVPKTDPLRTDAKANRGQPPQWFKNYLKQQCRGLAYCQDIANGTKHFEIKYYEPKVEHTTFSASVVQSAMPQFVSGTPTENGLIPNPEGIAPHQRAKIVVGTDRLPALEVFEVVADFWNRFLDQNNIS